jgi:hypothetical protein
MPAATGDLTPFPEHIGEAERVLPVAAPLAPLLPLGGLRRGSTVAVSGSASLLLALLAGPSRAGSWVAVVGMPALGLVAAEEAGVALDRLALVPAPGESWPTVAAALLDALDIVAVCPPRGRVRDADARRLAARGRQRGAVLIPYGGSDRWTGADLRLGVEADSWEGLGVGHGHLRARRVVVRSKGRGAAARPRRVRLWLPAPGGGIAPDPVSPLLPAVRASAPLGSVAAAGAAVAPVVPMVAAG